MPFLRICNCSLNPWDKKPPDQIAAEWFDNFKDNRPSLYMAENSNEEVEAVAAFSLANPSKVNPYHIMRIDVEDFTTVGIHPTDEIPGVTGVVAVDFRHWEITGDRAKLIALVSKIRDRVIAGEERLRWVGLLAQEQKWRQFVGSPPTVVIEEARRRSRAKLDKNKTPPCSRRQQMESELTSVPPTIPSHCIRWRAFLRYERRCQLSQPGTADEDWLESEVELRELYTKGIIGYRTPT
jgi:hypothetical protein